VTCNSGGKSLEVGELVEVRDRRGRAPEQQDASAPGPAEVRVEARAPEKVQALAPVPVLAKA
jgi:hypothetical protein